MKSFITLSLFIAIASADIIPGLQPRLPLVRGMPLEQFEGRITNGVLAKAGQFPHQVGMFVYVGPKTYFCCGTLIANSIVLTAAHCMDDADRVTVILGAIDIFNSSEIGQKRINSSDYVIHSDWNNGTLNNDIALIKLPEPIEFTSRIQPATLPPRDANYEGKKVWASGWGKDSDTATSISQFLRCVKVPVLDEFICNLYYFFDIDENKICASGWGGKSTCNGDSGGPLTNMDGGKNEVIGITSFGSVLGCEKGFPSVFTRVSSYLDWITENSSGLNLKSEK